MPPFGYRKRERSSPAPGEKKKTTPQRAKPTLFETVDSPAANGRSLAENKRFLQDRDDDEDSSLSGEEDDSEEFEDIPPAKRRKFAHSGADQDVEDEEDDEMEWEDAIQQGSSTHATPSASNVEPEIADVSISMNDDGTYIEPLVSAATGKKGPSKRERQVRVQTHCLHVQALMWHNTVRNSWLNDKQVQRTLVDGLTEGVKREVQKWKDAMATLRGTGSASKAQKEGNSKGKRGKKGKQKNTGRDWNNAAEQTAVDGGGSDPLLRLLKVLTAYWRKRFIVTAPGLRKQGYKPLRRLRDEVRGWEKKHNDPREYGERIESLQDFRKLAKKCEGSKDVGAQLFAALLRGLGLETRMVANIQPSGFGWSKAEEADPKKAKKKDENATQVPSESEDDVVPIKSSTSKPQSSAKTAGKSLAAEKPSRKSSRGNRTDPIDLDESDSPLSSPPSEPEVAIADDDGEDDISVIDITPPTPKKRPTKKYDRDMAFPNYWTEVCSPVSHKFYPVDPIVLSTIASNDELLQTFEPRGKRAEKSKQVMCYTIAFSSDGTAKDVTVRYLKRHQLPGKTKGMRMPVEKVPILNRRGKVKRYEDYDWFRTLMSIYDRPDNKRTAADDLEEQTDLKPFKEAREEKPVAKESLQGYKQSADFVLEQHLRREEAILPDAEPVKYFTSGKGDKAQEVPVYNREDVATCKTVESWHKEGRAIKTGEQPMKYVPVRAVTLIRKREMEDVQRETGEKMKQGLYSQAQTDWIIPPPIKDGVIPKNAFGNMDVYVPTMVPKGAVHLPLKGSAKLCRKLEIDYSEACTGFEFGKQRAVPVITGVVVAKEHEGMVRDAWRVEQVEIKRKEDTKRTATALHWWRKMLLGLRVLERMRVEYADGGGSAEDVNPFIKKQRTGQNGKKSAAIHHEVAGEMSGGFFPPGRDEEEVPHRNGFSQTQDGEMDDETMLSEEHDADMGEGGFLVEDDVDEPSSRLPENHVPITPVSLQSMHKTMDGAADSEADDVPLRTQPHKSKIVKATKPSRVRSKQSGANKAGKLISRRKVAVSSEGDEVSSSELSEPDSADDTEASEGEDSSGVASPPSKKNVRTNSPRVVVSNGTRPRVRSAKKSTPVRSQYFHRSEDSEDDEDGDESEAEVVNPRNTTARTKARR